MALKSIDKWAAEVAAYGFDKISKDNELKNAVSKALAKAHNKDVFNFLNDKGNARKKYDTYIAKANDINLSSELVGKCKAAKDDEKQLKKLIEGEVESEANRLFKTNLGAVIKIDVSFKEWVDEQNKGAILQEAKKIASDLDIKDVKSLAEAIADELGGRTADAKKTIDTIEKSENRLYSQVQKAIKSSSLT